MSRSFWAYVLIRKESFEVWKKHFLNYYTINFLWLNTSYFSGTSTGLLQSKSNFIHLRLLSKKCSYEYTHNYVIHSTLNGAPWVGTPRDPTLPFLGKTKFSQFFFSRWKLSWTGARSHICCKKSVRKWPLVHASLSKTSWKQALLSFGLQCVGGK